MIIQPYDELRHLVILSGLSARELSRRSGVHHRALTGWLRGRILVPRVKTMVQVAKAMDEHVELTPSIKKMLHFYGGRSNERD